MPRTRDRGMEVGVLPDQSGVDLEAVTSALSVLERRVLHIIREFSEGGIPIADVLSELQLLGKDACRLLRRAEDARTRRDLEYGTWIRLEEISRHCVWLYRKIRLEQIFFRKLHMEAGFRQMVSPEAFAIYEALLDLEERESRLETAQEQDLRQWMREEAPEEADTSAISVLPPTSEN